jgi:hypothetical protein
MTKSSLSQDKNTLISFNQASLKMARDMQEIADRIAPSMFEVRADTNEAHHDKFADLYLNTCQLELPLLDIYTLYTYGDYEYGQKLQEVVDYLPRIDGYDKPLLTIDEWYELTYEGSRKDFLKDFEEDIKEKAESHKHTAEGLRLLADAGILPKGVNGCHVYENLKHLEKGIKACNKIVKARLGQEWGYVPYDFEITDLKLIQDTSTPIQAVSQITGTLKGFPQMLRSLKKDVLIMPGGLSFLDDAFAEIAALLFDPVNAAGVQGILESNFNIQDQELTGLVKSAQHLDHLLASIREGKWADLKLATNTLFDITNQLFSILDAVVQKYSDDFFRVIPLGSNLNRLERSAISFEKVLNELNIHSSPSELNLSEPFTHADAIGDLISVEGYPCLSWSVESFIDDVKILNSIKPNQFDVYRDKMKAYRDSILSDIELLKGRLADTNIQPSIDLDIEGFIQGYLVKDLAANKNIEYQTFTFFLVENIGKNAFTRLSDNQALLNRLSSELDSSKLADWQMLNDSINKDISVVQKHASALKEEKKRLDAASNAFVKLVKPLQKTREAINTADAQALSAYWCNISLSRITDLLQDFSSSISDMIESAHDFDYQSLEFSYSNIKDKDGEPLTEFELAFADFIKPIEEFLNAKKLEIEATK